MLVLSRLRFPQSDNLALNTPSAAGKRNKDAICDLCLWLFSRKTQLFPENWELKGVRLRVWDFCTGTSSQVLVLSHLIVHMKKCRSYLSGPASQIVMF